MVPLSWKTHSSTLAWKISWMEEQGPWGRKESDTTEQLPFTLSLWVAITKCHKLGSL